MPAVLTRERFEDAKSYLLRAGRPLEQQLFRYHFENGDAAAVLRELATHQMPAGGFRDMGEGDSDVSSPMGTTCAFQHLVELPIAGDHPTVRQGIGYFLSTYDADRDGWSEEHDLHWGNPSAEIVGYLWRYRERVPQPLLEHVTAVAIDRFGRLPLPVPGFSDLCYLRLAQWIPTTSVRADIHRKVSEGVRQNLELDHARWHTGYFIKPYWYAMHPDAPLHDTLADEIELLSNVVYEPLIRRRVV